MRTALLICVLAIANGLVYAEPIASTRTIYYSISGDTARELISEMDTKAPLDDGKHYHANTHYYIKWTYHTEQHGSTCSLSDIKVSLDTVYTYPKWQNFQTASTGLQQSWERYFSKLQLHEEGHASHGAQAASEIETALQNMPTMENCDSLSHAANDAAYRILDRSKQSDVTYDADTDHGKRQGAVLTD